MILSSFPPATIEEVVQFLPKDNACMCIETPFFFLVLLKIN